MHPPFRGELPFAEWGTSWISLVGRLAPGVTFEAARAAMPAVSAALRAAAPVNDGIEVLLAEGVGLDPEARAQAGRVSLLLLAIAALVLLLTCANVANLFLARATARAQEMGVRLALGAGRARATRQLLTESVLLSVLAAAFAYPLVRAAAGALPALIPGGLVWSLAPDARVIAAMLGLGVLAGLLFGVFPAIAAARGGAVAALAANRATGGLGHTRVRDGLVVFQLAISLGLMTASALLGRSVLNAGSAEPGFNPRGLLVAFVAPGLTGRYDGEQALAFYDRLLDDLRGMPGVVSVTVATSSPLTGPQSRATRFPADRPDDPAVQFEAEAINVGPDYFETMGIPLIRGRALLGWRQEPEPVAVINQAAADFYWPGQDPIGKEFGGDGQRRTRVVGVVGDVQQRSLRRAAAPAVYQPLSAENFAAAFHLRTAGRPLDLARPVRERVALLDPGLPVMSLTDLQAAVAASIGETRTFGWLVTAFAGLAFALSIIGLYGLVSYAVSRRVREMGIRMALGAEPRRLIGMVLARGLTLTGVGIVTGLAVAWALSRALQGLLFGVSATNPAALAAASLLLLMAATLAAWLPARRAGRTDAVASLRD
jgi:predicted permease